MSQINIAGDTSGSIAIAAPLVAGSNTLTLPASTGTVLTSVSPASDLPSSIKGPAFSARNSTNQTLTNNTSTKVALQAEEFDTNNNFDSTTNYRFTPTVAGYYQINGQVKIENNSNAGTLLCTIFKNGLDYKDTQSTVRSGSNTSAGCGSVIYFNGSTDYVELYVNQVTTATATLISNGTLATWFNGAFVRSA